MKIHVKLFAIAVTLMMLAQCTPAVNTAAPPDAAKLIEASVAEAKATQKTVLVDFGASWCKWCRAFEAALRSPELSKLFSDNYVIVKLVAQESDDKKNLENPGATELMKKEGGDGLPFYMFLDGNTSKIADSMVMPKNGNIGYPVTDEEIQAFDTLLKNTAPRMTATERDKITGYLAMNAPK